MFNETHNRLSSSFFDHLLSYTASELWTREKFLRMRAVINFTKPIHWHSHIMRRMHEWMERKCCDNYSLVVFDGVIFVSWCCCCCWLGYQRKAFKLRCCTLLYTLPGAIYFPRGRFFFFGCLLLENLINWLNRFYSKIFLLGTLGFYDKIKTIRTFLYGHCVRTITSVGLGRWDRTNCE